ncbi:MAG: carboxyvinyl-carboxyphosphonate phosphorylmutase, partial [Proteobacteria bacterium]|nr:carboxyvinyl-carboxyphosphonate phosphorylmutase [Pseudomonadota bacterium]
EEMAAKIRSAVDTRRNDGFLIIARTDALAVEGFEAAVERAALYAEAGADLLFVEAPTSQEALAEIPKRLPQKPHLVNLAPLTPNLPADELAAMGFKLAIYPGICLAAVVTALQTELARLKDSGRQRDLSDWVGSFVEMNRFLGAEGWEALEKKYTSL